MFFSPLDRSRSHNPRDARRTEIRHHHPDLTKLQGWKSMMAEADLPADRWVEETKWALRMGLTGADSIDDKSIPTFARGELPHYAGINTFLKAPYAEDVTEVENYDVTVLGIPFDGGTTYRAGTRFGPQGVRKISALYTPYNYEMGVDLREQMTLCDAGDVFTIPANIEKTFDQISRAVSHVFSSGSLPIIIGGDHSVPLGGLAALAQQYPSFGILHLDAHGDLRNAYEGFQESHASIMFNALQIPQISKLVQVGIRDISHREMTLMQRSNGRVVIYLDTQLKQATFSGHSWLQQCQDIVRNLPDQVYISCDVDGLDPKLCPHTGTPVPGGLDLEEAYCLWREVVRSGRRIIGCDICETGSHEWDGNVSARILYKLFSLMTLSAG